MSNFTPDTIYALASARGKAGVSVIRLSGAKSYEILLSLTGKAKIEPRQAVFSEILNPKTNKLIDKCVVLYFKAPQSFTGEDIVEFQIHGSIVIIQKLFSILDTFDNVRMAEAGEFSKRAFLNSRIDLTEAEGIADLVAAETEAQAEQALTQMSGRLRNLYETWRRDLLNTLAYIEADIDFSDDEIPDNLAIKMRPQLEKLLTQIHTHLNDNNKGEILRDGIKVAVIGAPNAGKSSLMNVLAKREVAIVSEIAGTTRDVIETHLNIAGYPVILMDTAGLRETRDTIEKIGVDKALLTLENSDLKLAVFDITASDIDKTTIKTIDEKTIVVLNKCDLSDFSKKIQVFSKAFKTIAVSAKSGEGIENLVTAIKEWVEKRFDTSKHPIMPTRARHRAHLINTCEYLTRAIEQTERIELMAEDVRLAARTLGKITGFVDVDDLLDVIFRDFCIGK